MTSLISVIFFSLIGYFQKNNLATNIVTVEAAQCDQKVITITDEQKYLVFV